MKTFKLRNLYHYVLLLLAASVSIPLEIGATVCYSRSYAQLIATACPAPEGAGGCLRMTSFGCYTGQLVYSFCGDGSIDEACQAFPADVTYLVESMICSLFGTDCGPVYQTDIYVCLPSVSFLTVYCER
jgi:hypothetical protein